MTLNPAPGPAAPLKSHRVTLNPAPGLDYNVTVTLNELHQGLPRPARTSPCAAWPHSRFCKHHLCADLGARYDRRYRFLPAPVLAKKTRATSGGG